MYVTIALLGYTYLSVLCVPQITSHKCDAKHI